MEKQNTRKKRHHLQINKRQKKKTRVAIGASAYRRTIERRAAASTKSMKTKTKQNKLVVKCKYISFYQLQYCNRTLLACVLDYTR